MALTEWLMLCLLCERPTHGFAVARLLAQGGSMGPGLARSQDSYLPGPAAA
jgi:hypothetical protein